VHHSCDPPAILLEPCPAMSWRETNRSAPTSRINNNLYRVPANGHPVQGFQRHQCHKNRHEDPKRKSIRRRMVANVRQDLKSCEEELEISDRCKDALSVYWDTLRYGHMQRTRLNATPVKSSSIPSPTIQVVSNHVRVRRPHRTEPRAKGRGSVESDRQGTTFDDSRVSDG